MRGWLSKGKADLVSDLVDHFRFYRLHRLSIPSVEQLLGCRDARGLEVGLHHQFNQRGNGGGTVLLGEGLDIGRSLVGFTLRAARPRLGALFKGRSAASHPFSARLFFRLNPHQRADGEGGTATH